MDKLDAFLINFPFYTNQFKDYSLKYEKLINDIFYAYKKQYIIKSKTNIDERFKFHIFNIHNNPSNKKKKITKKIVNNYVDNLRPFDI